MKDAHYHNNNLIFKTMKNLRSLCLVVFISAFLLFFSACKDCKNESPRAQVYNNGNVDVSVQIKTSNGNTENINNVPVGTTSDFRSYAAGVVTFTISVDKVNYVETLTMEECFDYLIAIDANNVITTVATDLNE